MRGTKRSIILCGAALLVLAAASFCANAPAKAFELLAGCYHRGFLGDDVADEGGKTGNYETADGFA